MTQTFLLKLDVGDDTDLLGIAQEINDLLSDDHDVVSVVPWSPPNLGQMSQTPPVAPATQTQQTKQTQ